MELLQILVIAWMLAFAQGSQFNVPKYSPSYHRASRNVGPHPGATAPSGSESTTFKRVYSNPAELRILVRANCDSKPGRKELIQRAKQLSTPGGAVVQLDWEPISGQNVTYWAVASSVRKIAEVELSPEKGKFKAMSSQVVPEEEWAVSRLSLGAKTCVAERSLNPEDLKVAVVNFLNKFTLDEMRRSTDESFNNP